jgi:hypothetical protein
MASHETVCVDLNGSGGWEVTRSNEHDRFTRGTLDEAQHVAYLCAAHRRPCELVVRDAYHRVLRREFIDR